MVCWVLHHKLASWTPALFFLCFFLSLSIYFCISCALFLRPESSGDFAAFLSSSRSASGYLLLAAAVWSQRSPTTGQQSRPHPIRHCSFTRTRTPPRVPHKVSTKLILLWWKAVPRYTQYNSNIFHCCSFQCFYFKNFQINF